MAAPRFVGILARTTQVGRPRDAPPRYWARGARTRRYLPEQTFERADARHLPEKWSGGWDRRMFEPQEVPGELAECFDTPSDISPARREFAKGDIVSSQAASRIAAAHVVAGGARSVSSVATAPVPTSARACVRPMRATPHG